MARIAKIHKIRMHTDRALCGTKIRSKTQFSSEDDYLTCKICKSINDIMKVRVEVRMGGHREYIFRRTGSGL